MSKSIFEEFAEQRATSGVGACLYAKNDSGKYSIFMPLETAPNVMSNPETIEINVTSSNYVGKIEGRSTLEDKELDFYWHRDNIRRLNEYADKGVISFMVVYADYTAVKFNATISFTPNDSTGGDATKGTLKITPVKVESKIIDNAYDLLQPTAKFANGIKDVVYLDATNTSEELLVETEPSDATVTATSEDSDIATATYATGKVTLTRVATGSAVVTLKSSKTEYADWETTILVICK